MKDLVPFMMEHPFISLFMVCAICDCIVRPIKLWLRHENIVDRGWPPPHCDADGDFKPKPEPDEK